MSATDQADERLLRAALASARDTRCLRMGRGVRRETAEVFANLYRSSPALIIADTNTFEAAGRDVWDGMRRSGQACVEPLILSGENVYAEYSLVEQVQRAIAGTGAIPVAVGSGTISDLTKLAAHHCGRRYMTVATAASMDGYTAFGASITYKGSKQTFDCPAAQAVIADLDVIASAPEGMNASGYADLIAKIPAGADWLVAEACGVEGIDTQVWNTVQQRLRHWSSDPDGVRLRTEEATKGLITGLLMIGFAMQAACSSRPASGAEHQFSHLWDMEHHTHTGVAPLHGFKVGIGSLASIALYEFVLGLPVERLDVDAAVAAWPDAAAMEQEIGFLFTIDELAQKAREESTAKQPDPQSLRAQLDSLLRSWSGFAPRLRAQLVPRHEFGDMLRAAGAPWESGQIGISAERLELSYRRAYHIRRRFTILDLARRMATLDECHAGPFARLIQGLRT